MVDELGRESADTPSKADDSGRQGIEDDAKRLTDALNSGDLGQQRNELDKANVRKGPDGSYKYGDGRPV